MENSSKETLEVMTRAIRVFISSTFRDMQAERDELTKFIFPQLRKLCEQRGVTWGYVDLRWGITDEQKAEGKVLPICLESIHRCRPYFIGLLGERYGWIPDEINPELMELQPWLKEHLDHSVTELEILHGVLNNPNMAEHAYFYFRDPTFITSLPKEQHGDFLEKPTAEEIAKYGTERADYRAQVRQQKLAALKDRIRGSDFPVQENYRDPRELGQWVLSDLTALINRLYPEGSQPDSLDREATEHETFANTRLGVYIGRQTYFDTLDHHVMQDEPPLVILGESGFGKSALLANWVQQYRDNHPDEWLLMHFVGASPASADWAAMLRRIMGELKRHFDIHEEIPGQPDALRTAFANWLNMAAVKGRLVLILDALDQLEDRDQAPDLIWLPPVIPDNIRLIVSTLPGRSLDALVKRGWPTLRIEPLDPEERKQLIVEYIAESSKALSPSLVDQLANVPQAGNPLFIRTILDELLVFGSHELLQQRLDYYLASNTLAELFTRILLRYEEDYERDRPGLVGDAMSLLWAARHGLAEVELLELLGADDQPLAPALWAPLYLTAEQALVNRAGLIGFFHDHLRQAVERKYLDRTEAQHSVHLQLADYFIDRELGSRKLEELPWQFAQAEAWEQLYALLCDLPFFNALNQMNEFEVKHYWSLIEMNSSFRMLDGYHEVIRTPETHHDHVWDVALLLADTGHPQESLSLRDYLMERLRSTGDWGLLTASIGSQANLLYACGELDEALTLHREEESLCRELGLDGGLAISLVNQAAIHFDRGELDTAFELYKQAEDLFCQQDLLEKEPVRLAYKRGRAKSLTGQANVLSARGDLQAALALHKEAEGLCRELGHKDELVVALTNQGNTLLNAGDLDEAWALYSESETLCRETGNKQWLANSISNQANILYKRANLDQAMVQYAQAEQIFREIGHKVGLCTSLQNQAQIFSERGDSESSLRCYEEIEYLCREMGERVKLQNTLSDHAYLLYTLGNLNEAILLQQENEGICREIGERKELTKSLILQAVIVGLHMHRPRDAVPLVEEAHGLAVECNDSTLVQQIGTIQREIRNALYTSS
jgi:tetratricopeptide (TPR) repeat protein